MLAGNFGAETLDPFTEHHFWQALRQPEFTLEWPGEGTELPGGRHPVGNLAMLTSLIGTPWLPVVRDGILVVEDINEHPFRVERMLLPAVAQRRAGGAESGDLRQLHRQLAERL